MKKFLLAIAAVAALAFVGCDKSENEGDLTGGGDNNEENSGGIAGGNGSGALDGSVWISDEQGEKSVLAFTDGVYYLYMNVNEETGDAYGGAMTGAYSISGSSINMSITWADGAEPGEISAMKMKISGTVSGNKISLKMSAMGQSASLPDFYKDETNYGINSDNELAGTTWVSTYFTGEMHTLTFNEDGITFSLLMVEDDYIELAYVGYYRYADGEGKLFIDERANGEEKRVPMPVIWPWDFKLKDSTTLDVYVPFADDGVDPDFKKQ